MSDQTAITTTSGKRFSYADSCMMAFLVYRRFGRDLTAATRAWNRLLQNDCSEAQFAELIGYDPRHHEPGCDLNYSSNICSCSPYKED